MTTTSRAGASAAQTSEPNNVVALRGRLAAEPIMRELPSGDELCSFRVTVDRPEGDRVRVDSLECSTTRARVRRTLERAAPGDEVEVTGSLRRRFWRTPGGPASRCEVQVDIARLNRPGRRGGS